MVAAVRADPPAIVAIAFHDVTILTPRSSRDELTHFPELHGLILNQYVRDKTIGNFELWRRADREPR
jgi:hypothetical protein